MATPLRIGVLIVPPIQLLDIAPIDLFAMLSRSYFEDCKLPQPLLDLAIPDSGLSITYIAHTGPSSSSSLSSNNPTQSQKLGPPAPTTAHLNLEITAGLDDPRVLPGELDILMIPGPPPGMQIPEVVCEFVRAHVEKGVDLLTICTGIFVAAEAEVLNGKTATGSRGIMDVLEKRYQAVKWVDRRWSRDGRVWTAGKLFSLFCISLGPLFVRLFWGLLSTCWIVSCAS
jgi:putative intracellular protease/amidase